MEKYEIKGKKIELHNILFASTSEPTYEMDRAILLEELEDIDYNEYVVVEGYHCSCYGFDDCQWEAIKYTKDELIKLAELNKEDTTYGMDSINQLYSYVLAKLKR